MRSMRMVAMLLIASPALAEVRAFPIGQWGKLGINVPEGWTATAQGKDAPGGQAVKLTPAGDIPLVILMTPLPSAVPTGEELEEAARKSAERLREQLAPRSVEPLTVRELQSEHVHAFYVSLTDKTVETPTLTDFKYADQGALAVGRLMVSFTILSNVAAGPVREQALQVVRSARHLKPGPPWVTPEGGVMLSYPGKKWKLAMDLPGFEIDPLQMKSQGKGVTLIGGNPRTKMIVSARLEDAQPGWTAVDHREAAWKKMQASRPMDRQDVTRSERGPMAILEQRVPTFAGRTINQKNVNAYLVRDGVGVDVHLSKVEFQESDRELFEKILASLRLVD